MRLPVEALCLELVSVQIRHALKHQSLHLVKCKDIDSRQDKYRHKDQRKRPGRTERFFLQFPSEHEYAPGGGVQTDRGLNSSPVTDELCDWGRDTSPLSIPAPHRCHGDHSI